MLSPCAPSISSRRTRSQPDRGTNAHVIIRPATTRLSINFRQRRRCSRPEPGTLFLCSGPGGSDMRQKDCRGINGPRNCGGAATAAFGERPRRYANVPLTSAVPPAQSHQLMTRHTCDSVAWQRRENFIVVMRADIFICQTSKTTWRVRGSCSAVVLTIQCKNTSSFAHQTHKTLPPFFGLCP